MIRYFCFFSLLLFFAFIVISAFPETPSVAAHGWKAPVSEAARINPLPFDRQTIERGKSSYEIFCTDCHGKAAEGLQPEVTGLQHPTPNLKNRLLNHSEGDFHWKIRTGRKEMPGFGEELSNSECWEIIQYIKSLTQDSK